MNLMQKQDTIEIIMTDADVDGSPIRTSFNFFLQPNVRPFRKGTYLSRITTSF